MEIVKLKPAVKDYIWGGKRLFSLGKISSSSIIAESWEISFHDDGQSTIDSGINKGKYLKDIVSKEDLGKKATNFVFFPILNKFIDANDNLSLQVHPSDEYALKYENSYGKTEMWYVIDTEEDSFLYIGFNKKVSDEEVREKIASNSLMEIMNKVPVKKGDCYFIPSGTIHAIGKGCLIYEIQENSNLTYRIYDYGRKDKNGNTRELHIDKALKVLNKDKFIPKNIKDSCLAQNKYFTVNKLVNPKYIESPIDSFMVCTVIDGKGLLDDLIANKGDTFFIPAGKKITVKNNLTIISTNI